MVAGMGMFFSPHSSAAVCSICCPPVPTPAPWKKGTKDAAFFMWVVPTATGTELQHEKEVWWGQPRSVWFLVLDGEGLLMSTV